MHFDEESTQEPKREMTVREAGRRGGAKVKEKYEGTDFYHDIGHKGGTTTKERYGEEFYARIGQKGGEEAKRRGGPGFYKKIGTKGGNRLRELIAKAKAMEAQEAQENSSE